ncbi:MAG: SCO family protein [Alphaproteobacteria bacterium]|nr:SCO family protein [Alphaproteobacteria bacterium]MBU0797585.1 SCO family protein [Alphaproteobacteria bacterium]MBU0886627.1 SCO family protein [Alphaproteobacteria bacterium]MBU1812600.1 SCO family protein [Alphaproteobacteria bacterium]
MSLARLTAVLIGAFAVAMPALAHHPGADLDRVMGSKEQFFQAIDSPAPLFELADADGKIVKLSDFADKIVVLNFIFAGCTDVCPLHSALIADVQSKINITPMKDMVQFITVTTDPDLDTADVLRSYGEPHGLDPHNWMFLTHRPGDPEDATRKLSETYNVKFQPLDDGQQMHGVATHVIDRGGRFAAKFHGLRFEPLNLVLYINGLTNAPSRPSKPAEAGWWDSVKGLFR